VCHYTLSEIRRRWINDDGVKGGRVSVDWLRADARGGAVGITTRGEREAATDSQKDVFRWSFDKDVSSLRGPAASHAFTAHLGIDHSRGRMMNAPVYMVIRGHELLRRDLPGEARFYSDTSHVAHAPGPRVFSLHCDWHPEELVEVNVAGVQNSGFDLVLTYVFSKSTGQGTAGGGANDGGGDRPPTRTVVSISYDCPNLGMMHFTWDGDAVTGTYGWSGGGRVQGRMQGRTLVGRWSDTNGRGNTRYEFTPDRSRFEHHWQVEGASSWSNAGTCFVVQR
jgi:hypothetical protein